MSCCSLADYRLMIRSSALPPAAARVARVRLSEDVRRAAAAGRLDGVLPAIAIEFVLGITVRAMQSAAEGRLKPKQAPLIVAGILRAIGVSAAEAHEVSSHLGKPDRQKS